MTNWSNERELEFLSMYQTEPVLWDQKHPSHKDRSKTHHAWERISDALDIPVAELRRKKDSLMATFRMHRRRIRASEITESGAYNIHKPTWFAFDLMNSFLGESLTCAGTTDSNHVEEKDDISVEHEHELIVMDSFPITQFHTPSGERERRAESVSSTSRRRRRQPEPVEVGPTINDPLNSVILKEEEEDECDLYGRLLARKLRRLSELERLSFMHEIDGIFIRRLQENLQK